MENKLEKFTEKIAEIYPDKYQEVVELALSKKATVFRVNTLKCQDCDVLSSIKAEGFEYIEGPFKNTYIITKLPESKRLSDTDAFKVGEIYIQSLSSMLAVFVLDPKPGEQILDMCASPGSKTSLIAQLTSNGSHITSVDNNRGRFFALKKNMENLGVKNIDFYLENGLLLPAKHFELLEHYDKILLDAPCSNEANINFEMWNSKAAKHLSKLQKGLLFAAVKMLKRGGELVYSTCTFSVDENEEVINWLLTKVPNIKVEEIAIEAAGLQKVQGFTSWKGSDFSPQLSKSMRVFPNANFVGFYICKLKLA